MTMSASNYQGQSIEDTEARVRMEEARIARNERLTAFRKSAGYKEFIEDGFLKEEMLRLLGESSNFAWPTDQRSEFLVQAKAGGVLTSYFDLISISAERASKVIVNLQAEIEYKRNNGEI